MREFVDLGKNVKEYTRYPGSSSCGTMLDNSLDNSGG